jgi:putative DNA primase/helicase
MIKNEETAPLRRARPRSMMSFKKGDIRHSPNLACRATTDSASPMAHNGLPTIQINNGELSCLATRGEQLLISAGVPIYQRGGKLVRPIIEIADATRGRKTSVVQLKELDATYLRDLLCRHARWKKLGVRSKKPVPINPPAEIAETILARTGDWNFPSIAGVISAPTMRPDGSLLTEPGYDEVTRLLLVEPPTMPPIPGEPTRKDAKQALDLLESLLVGFPFDDDVARSVALSAMITPVVRGAFPVTPMHTSRAPVAGSGKSFLFDTVSAIAIGQPMPVISTGKNEAELEKRLGTAFMAGQPLISIDNVTGELGGEALCQLIERPVVDIRILGKSEKRRIEARGTSLFATGNNFVIVGDVCRRTVTTNLDPRVERPELRQFAFDPVDRVLADRGKYIAAALTICRAYRVAGQPGKAPKLASFEGWSDTVRSALIWLGKADPVQSMEAARAEDPELAELANMLQAWSAAIGEGNATRMKAADVLLKGLSTSRESQHSELEPTHPDFHAALMTIAQRSTGRSVEPDGQMLGKWLQKFKGRIVDGQRFTCLPNAKRGNEWWVERV